MLLGRLILFVLGRLCARWRALYRPFSRNRLLTPAISYCNDYVITPIPDRSPGSVRCSDSQCRKRAPVHCKKRALWSWRETSGFGGSGRWEGPEKSVSTSVWAGGNGRVTARRQCRFGVVSGVGPADRSDRPMKIDLEGRQSVA